MKDDRVTLKELHDARDRIRARKQEPGPLLPKVSFVDWWNSLAPEEQAAVLGHVNREDGPMSPARAAAMEKQLAREAS